MYVYINLKKKELITFLFLKLRVSCAERHNRQTSLTRETFSYRNKKKRNPF